MKPPLKFVLLLIMPTLAFAQGERRTDFSPLLHAKLSDSSTKHIRVLIQAKVIDQVRADKDVQVLYWNPTSQTAIIELPVMSLRKMKGIRFADVMRTPKEETIVGGNDITLNTISSLHKNFPQWRGNGIRISVKEQRFDSADIDLRARTFTSINTATNITLHATLMATIIAGGGNTRYDALGVAPAALLTSNNFSTLLPEPTSVYQQYNLTIQNHSYGTGIENYYGADARAYDISVNELPSLLHVFSAGNIGNTAPASGTYAGIAGFANISGSFKMSKNTLAIGSTDSFNLVLPLSSRGPAYDGRLKPELVAFGSDGSSGAAALVSGSSALLQQAFKNIHGRLPQASTIRALLLNTATDLGNRGPDYVSGYGALNAYDAMQALVSGRMFEDSIAADQSKSIIINIPAGLKKARIMIAWDDAPTDANSSKALIHDLDLVVTETQSGNSWQPWVLNHFPHQDSLLQPAQRKRDSLNTMEQVTIDSPAAGVYQIIVRTGALTTSHQRFSVTYQFDTAQQFSYYYPLGGEKTRSGSRTVIRWKTGLTGNAIVEYRMNNGAWQNAGSVNIEQQNFAWSSPPTAGKASIRITHSSGQFITGDFVVAELPELHVGLNCPDSVLLYWNKVGADSFKLYQLGLQYLEPVTVTPDSFRIFQKTAQHSMHYAVAPFIFGMEGLKSPTIDYRLQGAGCYVDVFLAIQQGQGALLDLKLGTNYSVATASFQKRKGTQFIDLATVSVPQLQLSYLDTILQPGLNLYRVKLTLQNGTIIYSPHQQIYRLDSFPLLVFPNPARAGMAIQIINNEPGNFLLSVFDAIGSLVYSKQLNDQSNNYPSLRLPAGLYFMHVQGRDGRKYTQKLIIQ